MTDHYNKIIQPVIKIIITCNWPTI